MAFFDKPQSENFIENGKKEITLGKICKAMEIPVPARFKTIEDKINNNITTSPKKIKNGSIYFLLLDKVEMKPHLENAISKGAKVIFVGEKEFRQSGLNENKYPVILLDKKIKQIGAVYSQIRQEYYAKAICIAGMSGKTITKKLIKQILGKTYNAFVSGDNSNSYISVANNIFSKINEDTEVFVQEVETSAPIAMKKTARLLRPDVCIFLNSADYNKSHIDFEKRKKFFEGLENLDKFASSNGVVIVNNDDDEIAAHIFKRKVVSFGIDTKEKVNYRASNITQNKEFLEFDIIEQDYEDQITHIKVNGTGQNMVYNVLAAFAAARYFHMSNVKIANAIESYKSTSINGYFRNIGGRYIYLYDDKLDENTISDIKNLSACILDKTKGRVFAVIERNEDNKSVCENMYMDAETAGFADLIFVDESLASLQNAEKRLKDISDGDLVIYRGTLAANITILIDKILGTSLSNEFALYTDNEPAVNLNDFRGIVLPLMNEVEVAACDKADEVINIPQNMDGYPVYRIAKHVFKDNESIRVVDLGSSIKNIGVGAFYNCPHIEKLLIPGNVKMIESGAFRNCKSLKEVTIEEGVIHISKNVFRGCESLTDIYIPDTVLNIGENAFEGCDEDLTVHCKSKSLAAAYAEANGIKVEVTTEL